MLFAARSPSLVTSVRVIAVSASVADCAAGRGCGALAASACASLVAAKGSAAAMEICAESPSGAAAIGTEMGRSAAFLRSRLASALHVCH